MEDQDKSTAKKPLTKTEFVASLAEAADLSKQQISKVLDELSSLIANNLQESGPGVLVIPGLLKISVVRKPATEARAGINPFTKEETIFKAKPAKNVVKLVALKGLKDLV